MAFSFRAGTNWCHDFPKLARESGFYFNMHTARVRVDWNRISSIDIERVIRDRDFQTVDENVNNVIDYYLETEYDVKILDPNFVKLFRLAQLAVEYLLYCKQYLDQSVVILKEELKYKIAENVKLKEETIKLQESIKEMKEKVKERSKVEIKSDSHGEIHKCPHCPKTFVSASFANAHLVRRHSNISDVLSSSPAQEEYRTETEKLHNEIKTLKERLNQTERVIRNESIKETSKRDQVAIEDLDSLHKDQHRRYQEEISNLKSLLFTEIRNIKRSENIVNKSDNEANQHEIKEVINQQEHEIQRLKNQLQEHLTLSTNEVENKLVKQEEYWKCKIEQLENQHRNDIENLFMQLKLTQESASRMKSEYEEKVSYLEKQSNDQSKLLTAQSEQLNNLSRGMLDVQHKKISETESRIQKYNLQKVTDSLTENTVDTESSDTTKKLTQNDKQTKNILKRSLSYNRLLSNKTIEDSRNSQIHEESTREYSLTKLKGKKPQKTVIHRKITKAGNKYSSLDESEKTDKSTNTESDTDSEEETETSESSETQTESTSDEAHEETKISKIQSDHQLKKKSPLASLELIRQNNQETFENKLRALGIDPEWNGVPIVTFTQKMETIKHQQNLSTKKYLKYEQIRRKILEEISRRISIDQKSLKSLDFEKKSFLNKAMKNVKSKALKALNDFKVQKGNDTSTLIVSPKNSAINKTQTKRRFSLELLPKKPTRQDIQEIKEQTRLETIRKQKKEDQLLKSKSTLPSEDNIHQEKVETLTEPSKRTKLLQKSYQSIEEFMKDIEGSPKSGANTAKVMLSASTNSKTMLQDSYNFGDSSDDQKTKQDAKWALSSPKNNKSVLKSTLNTTGNLVKKKVIFDLEKENTSSETKPIEDYVTEESNIKKEINDSDCNISSISEEKEIVNFKEKSGSTENIQLKTSQSEKIAEISKKIQEKLEASRRKPVGSIEAMFSAKGFSIESDNTEAIHTNQSSTEIISVHNSPSSHIEARPRGSLQLPRPAPRRQLFETKDSDLDMDVDDILAIN